MVVSTYPPLRDDLPRSYIAPRRSSTLIIRFFTLFLGIDLSGLIDRAAEVSCFLNNEVRVFVF